MELELGLALPNQAPMKAVSNLKQKCKFAEADKIENKKLCLLLWSGQPNGEEDDRRRLTSSTDNKKSNDGENKIVGWPPINSLRKEMLHQYHGGNNNGIRNRQSLYVKVKMEGVAVGRKIDLRLFNSYQPLKRTLFNMFSRYLKIDRNCSEYTIFYQNREGNWLLAEDVLWETFMESVQRMEMLRNDSLRR